MVTLEDLAIGLLEAVGVGLLFIIIGLGLDSVLSPSSKNKGFVD